MTIPENIDILYWVTLKTRTSQERYGEVQHIMDFPKTALIATTDFIMVDDEKYDLFTTDNAHFYIIVNYYK